VCVFVIINVIVVVMLRQALFLGFLSFFFIHNSCCSCFLVTFFIAVVGLLRLGERRESCAYASCGVCRVHALSRMIAGPGNCEVVHVRSGTLCEVVAAPRTEDRAQPQPRLVSPPTPRDRPRETVEEAAVTSPRVVW
jgi:hypothetical protein